MRNNMRVIGKGVNGTVYLRKNGSVLKKTDDLREVQALLKLKDLPFVPRIRNQGVGWFSMNRLPVGTKPWSKWKATDAQKSDAFRQLKANVNALHAKGISHGDLHTDNVLVNKMGKVWIIDFGRYQPIGRHRESTKYTRNKYVFNYNGVPTYSFNGILSRRNRNMLKGFRV